MQLQQRLRDYIHPVCGKVFKLEDYWLKMEEIPDVCCTFFCTQNAFNCPHRSIVNLDEVAKVPRRLSGI